MTGAVFVPSAVQFLPGQLLPTFFHAPVPSVPLGGTWNPGRIRWNVDRTKERSSGGY